MACVCFKKATADVGVRVRRTVVVHVERPVILVLVIVTAMVQARVTTVEIPVIRDIVCCKVDPALSPYQRKSGLLEQNRSILNFYKAEVGGRDCGPLTPNPLLYRGISHAAFGGRSWRRQPMTEYVTDALLQLT